MQIIEPVMAVAAAKVSRILGYCDSMVHGAIMIIMEFYHGKFTRLFFLLIHRSELEVSSIGALTEGIGRKGEWRLASTDEPLS